MPPLNFPVMPAGLPVEIIAKVPSRYYRVPRYFFTVLTRAHNWWYHPTPAHMWLVPLYKISAKFVKNTNLHHNSQHLQVTELQIVGQIFNFYRRGLSLTHSFGVNTQTYDYDIWCQETRHIEPSYAAYHTSISWTVSVQLTSMMDRQTDGQVAFSNSAV